MLFLMGLNMSLVKYFKENILKTNIGDFIFVEQIGQGGNALVYEFKRGENSYAIKFIEHTDKKKIDRFIDEYFCASQIESHENIAQGYHFDTVSINGKLYSLIIMKKYSNSLKRLGAINNLSNEEKSVKGWILANSLLKGLDHLHKNKIIHRDIKPENIFFDDSSEKFVIGDLGIAHFSEELAKQAHTKEDERLSNYLCSPIDQILGKTAPIQSWDLYAMGQVINWYLFGDYIRGDGKVLYNGSDDNLKILDKIIKKSVQNSPNKRFFSVDEIRDFVKNSKTVKRGVFQRLFDFDEVVRSSLPKMKEEFYETTSSVEIKRFLENFSKKCQLDEFWYITDSGGDNSLDSFNQIGENRWLMANSYELKIEKIIVYKNSALHKSLFIIFTEHDNSFEIIDADGRGVERDIPDSWNKDFASFYKGSYYEQNYFDNGYIENNGVVEKINYEEVSHRERILQTSSFMIVPKNTGPAFCDWRLNEEILQIATNNRNVTQQELLSFIRIANSIIDPEISMFL